MSDNIVISVEDRVNKTVATKFVDMAKSARDLKASISEVEKAMKGLSMPPSARMIGTFFRNLRKDLDGFKGDALAAAQAITALSRAQTAAAAQAARAEKDAAAAALATARSNDIAARAKERSAAASARLAASEAKAGAIQNKGMAPILIAEAKAQAVKQAATDKSAIAATKLAAAEAQAAAKIDAAAAAAARAAATQDKLARAKEAAATKSAEVAAREEASRVESILKQEAAQKRLFEADLARTKRLEAAKEASWRKQQAWEMKQHNARNARNAKEAREAAKLAAAEEKLAKAHAKAAAAADRQSASLRKNADAASRAERSTNSLGSAYGRLSTIAASAGIALSSLNVISLADQYIGLQNRIKMVSDSHEQMSEGMERVADIAQRTYGNLEATTTLYARMDRTMQYMGRSQEDTLRIVETVNKALAVGGLTAQEAAAAQLQLSQAFNSGRLNGDEFRSVSENMPMFLDAVAEATGRSRMELKQMSADGEITSEVMIAAFEKMANKVDGAFSKVTPRIGQAFTNLQTAAIMFFGKLNEQIGLTGGISKALLWMADNMQLVASYATAAAVVLGVKFVGGLALASLATASFAAVIKTALITTGIGAIIVGVGYAINAFLDFSAKVGGFGEAIRLIGGVIQEVMGRIPLFVQGALASIPSLIESLNAWVSSAFSSMTTAAMNAVAFITSDTMTIPQKFATVMDSAKSIVWSGFMWLYNRLPAPIQGMVDNFAANFGRIGDIVKGAVLIANAHILDMRVAFNDTITDMIGDAETLPQALVNAFLWVVDQMVTIGAKVGDALYNGVIAGINMAVDGIKWLVNQAIGYINKLIDAISNIPGVSLDRLAAVATSAEGGGLQPRNTAGEIGSFKAYNAERKATTEQMRTEAASLHKAGRDMISAAIQPAVDVLNSNPDDAFKAATAELESQKAIRTQIAKVQADEEAKTGSNLRAHNAERAAAYEAEKAALDDTNEKKKKGAKSDADSADAKGKEAISTSKILADLEKEIELQRMLPKEREIEGRLMQIKDQFQQDGVSLSEQEVGLIRQKLELLQQETELAKARDQILNDTIYKRRQELSYVQAIAQAQSAPGFTAGDTATAIMASGAGEAFAGTDIAMTAQMEALQQQRAIVQAMRDADIVSERQASAARFNIFAKEQELKTQRYADFFGVIAQLASSGNERLAKIGKAAAIAQAIIQTYQSATSAYAAMAGIPVVGPALGAAAAAAAVAAGLANVAAIRSQNTNVGAAGGGFMSGGYTGNIATNAVAGVVHGREFVMNADATRRIGVGNLESLQNGTATLDSVGNPGYSEPTVAPVVNVIVVRDEAEAQAAAEGAGGNTFMVDVRKNRKELMTTLGLK